MVIHNAKQRMIGSRVGSWDDEVEPGRVIKEVLKDCQTYLENDTLQPRTLSKKRKRTVESLQSNITKPNRTSKRLKQSEGS